MTDRTIEAWVMTAPGEPMVSRELPWPDVPPGEALVRVAGCGVCHTDVSFLYQGVKTRADLPLTLGHEITGTVVEVGEKTDPGLVDKPVVVPAVLPCGRCERCRSGHLRICREQVMPGNDRHGGYASHVLVPARYLCEVDDALLATHELWELSVVSDAMATPFQAVVRSELGDDELAVFVGAGGIGIHGIQIAAATGAKVVAIDVDPGRLELASAHGARAAIDARELSSRDLRKRVASEAEALGAPSWGWKIYETSGTRAGQEAAFSLLGFGATLAIVGFTMDRLEVRLSNLMAFDASAFGVWGSDPTLYPTLLRWIADGRLRVKPFIERRSLSEINSTFDAAHRGELAKRVVLVPDGASGS